jgi:hypothetical protein
MWATCVIYRILTRVNYHSIAQSGHPVSGRGLVIFYRAGVVTSDRRIGSKIHFYKFGYSRQFLAGFDLTTQELQPPLYHAARAFELENRH